MRVIVVMEYHALDSPEQSAWRRVWLVSVVRTSHVLFNLNKRHIKHETIFFLIENQYKRLTSTSLTYKSHPNPSLGKKLSGKTYARLEKKKSCRKQLISTKENVIIKKNLMRIYVSKQSVCENFENHPWFTWTRFKSKGSYVFKNKLH